jgi:UDP-glucose 4-epimerase
VGVLVTGGAGFIGSHLVDELLARGTDVVVLDDLSTGSRANLRPASGSGRLKVVVGSVLDRDTLDPLVADADAVLHMASVVGVRLVVSRPLESLQANIEAAQAVTTAASRQDARLLFASTSEVYGRNRAQPLAEESDLVVGSPSVPRWWYAHAKIAGESLAVGHHRQHGTETMVARIFNAVGQRQTGRYGMVLPRFVCQAVENRPLTVYGDGQQARCFTHVSDIVEALLKLLECDAAVGRIFNVGNPSATSIIDLAEVVRERAGSSSRILLTSYRDAFGVDFEDLPLRVPDISAIQSTTGWTPRRDLVAAIDDALAEPLTAFAKLTAEPSATL